jgi:hypothetical protein
MKEPLIQVLEDKTATVMVVSNGSCKNDTGAFG